jgi:hypothetical protein
VQDLTGKHTQHLVNSSMSGGNTVHDQPELSMTAPGTAGVNDYADVASDHLPLPDFAGPQIPVSHPGQRERVKAEGASHGGGRFDVITVPGAWKET